MAPRRDDARAAPGDRQDNQSREQRGKHSTRGSVEVLHEVCLHTIELRDGESVRIRLVEYRPGGVRLDIRRHYTGSDGQERPTQKGISIKPEWLPEIRRALDRFAREVEKARVP